MVNYLKSRSWNFETINVKLRAALVFFTQIFGGEAENYLNLLHLNTPVPSWARLFYSINFEQTIAEAFAVVGIIQVCSKILQTFIRRLSEVWLAASRTWGVFEKNFRFFFQIMKNNEKIQKMSQTIFFVK